MNVKRWRRISSSGNFEVTWNRANLINDLDVRYLPSVLINFDRTPSCEWFARINCKLDATQTIHARGFNWIRYCHLFLSSISFSSFTLLYAKRVNFPFYGGGNIYTNVNELPVVSQEIFPKRNNIERRRGWLRFLCCEFSAASNNRAYFHEYTRAVAVKNAAGLPRYTVTRVYAYTRTIYVERDRKWKKRSRASRTTSFSVYDRPRGWNTAATWKQGNQRWKGLLFESSHIRLLRRHRFRTGVHGRV